MHRMSYTEWGDPRNTRVLLCVHALTRNGRDFDFLARALSSHYRVVCPDIAGRGVSERLKDPAGYVIPTYVADIVTLIARLDVETVDWVGVSMGGLIGIALASMDGSPVRRLVLSDVGPEITPESIARIASYVGTDPRWPSFAEAEAYIRAVSAPFGELDDAIWHHLTEHSIVQDADGTWRFRYDPRVAEPFKASFTGEPSVHATHTRRRHGPCSLGAVSIDDRLLEGGEPNVHEERGPGFRPGVLRRPAGGPRCARPAWR